MNKEDLEQTILENTEVTFSRSAGPGGQNVNKLNTKVTARLPLSCLSFLSDAEMARIKAALKNRITNQDEIVLQVQDMRNQMQNRTKAIRRILLLIINALKVRKRRINTKPAGSQIEKRLQYKKEIAEKKRRRRLI